MTAKLSILLAGESTGNLNSKTDLDVQNLTKLTAEKFGQTMVMITHNEEITQMADRVIRIEDGKILYDDIKGDYPQSEDEIMMSRKAPGSTGLIQSPNRRYRHSGLPQRHQDMEK